MSERIILGIDPGTTIMGYGIICTENQNVKLLAAGVVNLEKIKDHFLKLQHIFDRTVSLIEQYHPDELAIEEPFYGKNVQSMLKLGRAQGVAISAALHRQLPVFGYSPRKIKQSVTGRGNASKEQVAAMLRITLNFENTSAYLDASDGLAAAVCHFYQNGNANENGKRFNGWKNFLSANPERMIDVK